MSKNVRVQVPIENLVYLSDALKMRKWEQQIEYINDTNIISKITFNKPRHSYVTGEAFLTEDKKIEMKIDHMSHTIDMFNTEIGSAYSAVKIIRESQTMSNIIIDEYEPYVIKDKSIIVNAKVIL